MIVKFALSCKDLVDFCKVCEKFLGKSAELKISCTDGVLTFCALCVGKIVDYKTPLASDDFVYNIDYTRFIQGLKNATGDLAYLTGNKVLTVKRDNLEIKFPSKKDSFSLPELELSDVQVDPAFFTGIVDLTVVNEEMNRFFGILLNPQETWTDICKISGQCIRVAQIPGVFPLGRCVISTDLAKAAVYPKSFNSLVYNKKLIGFSFGNNIRCVAAYIEDTYPAEYSSFLQVPEHCNYYKFEADELLFAASSVSSIMGDEEMAIKFCVDGQDGQKIVWSLSSRSYNGLYAAEKLYGDAIGSQSMRDFKLNKKQFLKTLKTLSGLVYIKDVSDSYVVLCEESASNNITVLSKVG